MQGNPITKKNDYDRAVTQSSRSESRLEAAWVAGLAVLVRLRLGRSLDPETLAHIAHVQATLGATQRKLASELVAGKLGPDEHFGGLSAAIEDARNSNRFVLGRDDFEIIFGRDGG